MAQNDIRVKIVRRAGDKTVVGETSFLRQHRKYKKYIKVFKRYLIHDEDNSINIGDEVSIKSSRPISKRKTWVIISRITSRDSGDGGENSGTDEDKGGEGYI
ncbi:MAG: mitochondrial small ribosomal subunit protein uS17m [Rickettsiales bacterium]|jgi:small subunit ribosomal protein S17|nr:mitochondrial small ribosomal subunit protein uS17m [Rickettsiales bacterium]